MGLVRCVGLDLTLAWDAAPGSTSDVTNVIVSGAVSFTNIVYADIVGYRVYQATSLGEASITNGTVLTNFVPIMSVPASVNQVTISNLNVPSSIFFVKTFNVTNESPPSNWVTVPSKATSPAKTRITAPIPLP